MLHNKSTREFNATRLMLELLEDRTLLSVPTAHTNFLLASPSSTRTPGGGLSPAQIQEAYDFNLVQFSGGAQGNGSGQTIAIVDAFDDPNISGDLQAFDTQYNLPNPGNGFTFTKVGQTGGSPPTATDPTGNWEVEISLDVEWAHALAPQANILLVEANSASMSDLYTAVDTARNTAGVSVVSMSWGFPEYSTETNDDSHFRTPSGHAGVTFVAATGDTGQLSYPAVSPNVLAVGGTDLSIATLANGFSVISSETGWLGSGGGISVYESTQPTYQNGVVTQTTTNRANPDVAFDANQASGVSVYDSFTPGSATIPWFQVGGTSFATPAWAALIAITDQGRVLAGQGTLDGLGQTLPQIYALPAGDLHDIVTGNNGDPTGHNGNPAGPGYDLVTGRGSPDARRVVADLSGNQPPQQIFFDNFNRANSGNLGANWLQVIGTTAIQNNMAQATTSSGTNFAVYNVAALADVDVSANVTLPTGSGKAVDLVARDTGSGDNTFYMAALFTSDGTTYNAQIYKLVAGTATLLASTSVGSSSGLLDFQVVGSSLRLLFNGIVVAAATDTQITSSGLAGMRGTLNSTWDNFSLSALTTSLPFSDNFNRANSSNLGLNWIQVVGSTGVQNNMAQATSSSGINSALYAGAPQADVDISANVALPAGGGKAADLVARDTALDDNTFYMGALYTSDGTTYNAQIYKLVGGTATLLASASVGSSSGLLDFQVFGPILRLFFNTSLVATAIDSQISGPGLAGIRGTVNSTWDNFNLAMVVSAPFSDNFNRANSSNLGANWLQVVGTTGIQNNMAQATNSSGINLAVYNGAAQADVDVSANVALPTGSGKAVDLVARDTGPGDNTFYMGALLTSDGTTYSAQIYKLVGGTATLLASASVGSSSGPLDFQVVGSSLRLLFNGALVASAIDTQIIGPGAVGIRGTLNSTWDNFTVTVLRYGLLPFSDNFNRANSSNLGSNWVQATGSTGLQNNLAVATTSGNNIALYAGAAQADVDVSATITDPSVAGSAADLVARYSGPGDNNMYMGAVYTTNGTTFSAQIYKIVAGTATLLASAGVGSGSGTLDFQVLGDFLKLSFNGVGVAAFDTQITAPGLAGIKGTLNSTWDNFTVSTLTPALPFSDAFTRANSSNLGPYWFQPAGAGSFGVQNNQALASASAVNLTVYAYDAQPDVNVSADIALTSRSGQVAELVGRYSGSGDSNMYTGGVTANSDGTFTAAIYKNIGGTRTLLASQTITTGTGTLTFQIVGSDLRLLFVDATGTVLGLISVFDTSITAGGAVGIRSNNGVSFDNFVILG